MEIANSARLCIVCICSCVLHTLPEVLMLKISSLVPPLSCPVVVGLLRQGWTVEQQKDGMRKPHDLIFPAGSMNKTFANFGCTFISQIYLHPWLKDFSLAYFRRASQPQLFLINLFCLEAKFYCDNVNYCVWCSVYLRRHVWYLSYSIFLVEASEIALEMFWFSIC